MAKRISRASLVPLLREGADDVERALLVSARLEAPSDPLARARTLAAVKAASRTAAVAGAGALGWRWLRAISLAKVPWVAVGGVAGLVTAGGAIMVSQALAPPEEPSTSGAKARTVLPSAAPSARPIVAPSAPLAGERAEAPPSPRSSVPASTRPATPPVDTADAPRASPPARDDTPAASSGAGSGSAGVAGAAPFFAPAPAPAEHAPPATALHEEALLLESARAALAAGSTASAIAALDRYDARFSSGALAEEAAVLRVQALLAAHRPAEARQVTEDFARRRPASSYVPRMRALVDHE